MSSEGLLTRLILAPRRLGGVGKLALAANRRFFPRLFGGICGYLVLNEFPKSGGSWCGQMMADALDVPFPRHKPLGFGRCIVHGHFHDPKGLGNVTVLWRDPRDVFVSYYYHSLFRNELHNAPLVSAMRDRLAFDDFSDIRANLPDFIRFLHETPYSPRFTWPQFAEVWAGREDCVHTRYEDLRHDGPAELVRIAKALTGTALDPARAEAIYEQHSFARHKAAAQQAATASGAEMSFVREGATGGWQKHFTPEAETLVERYCGPAMAKLGYS